MKRRNIRFATICLSLLVAAVSISMIAAASLVPNAYAQPSGQQKGEKATPKELVTTGMLNATSNATKSPSAVGGANMTNQTAAQK
jgi:cytochrome c-type biogenesis protein CcmE